MPHWLPLLEEYLPILLLLKKPIDKVRASYARRGERLNAAEVRFRKCREIIRRWLWQKLVVDFHAIGRPVSGFDATRHGHDGHGISK